jgi:hypothetical protein
MAVQPDANKFIDSIASDDVSVIFEGDRLFNSKFIDHILSHTNEETFKVLVLETSHGEKEKRHIDRKDDQDDKFKNSRKTKISNICSSLVLMDYINVMPNENVEHQQNIIDFIGNFFNWSE